MKILMVTRESQVDKRYGLNKSLAPVIAALVQRGVEVGYLCQEDVGVNSMRWLRKTHYWLVKLFSRFFTHTNFISLSYGLLERLNMGRLAAKVMVREHYTHVHCHDPIIAAGYRWFARLRWFMQLRRGHTARWGITEHGFGCYSQAFHEDGALLGTAVARWLRRWEAKIALKAHWVMMPTHSGLRQLSRDLALFPLPNTWYVIHHPRPVLNYYPKIAARQQLAWTLDTLYIIAVGRFAVLKQFPDLVRACAQLSQAHWQLVFIGEGDRAPLHQLAVALGIADKVAFAVTEDMGLYYSAADIYVSTSSTEAFGLANLEALVMGLPAICTAVGGVAEVVGHGAMLIPAHNAPALVSALQTLVNDAAQRHYRSRQAIQWAHHWPDSHTIAAAYLTMYQGLPPDAQADIIPVSPPDNYFPFQAWQQQINQWHICPLPRLLTLPQNINVLMIAPHPDDETLGCGGTLALLRQQGCHVKVAIITDGSQGDPLGYSAEEVVSRRQRESITALNILGIQDVICLHAPDSHYQYTETIATQLTALLENYQADWILLPSVLDYHRDHVAISLSLLELWQQHGCEAQVFCYETWGPIPATWVVDITAVFPLKQQSISCYQLPMKYCDYTSACVGMAQYRGLYISEQYRGRYAEALLEMEAHNWPALLTHFLNIRAYQEHYLQKGNE